MTADQALVKRDLEYARDRNGQPLPPHDVQAVLSLMVSRDFYTWLTVRNMIINPNPTERRPLTLADAVVAIDPSHDRRDVPNANQLLRAIGYATH